MFKIHRFLILFCVLICSSLNAQAPWEKFKKEALASLNEVVGWCSQKKAEKMMDLIHDTHPKVCVEIGVFGGASLFPTAQALCFLGDGIVYGIDPWSKQEALKGYSSNDPNYVWWSQIDMQTIYYQLFSFIYRNQLTFFCSVKRMTSAEALSDFVDESIDILHIDGNHSAAAILFDVTSYYPKVKKGGYIWLNDADWSSAINAVIFLSDNAEWDAERSYKNKCLLFRKPLEF